MGKRIKKRVSSKKGFTLAETLVAILILLMVTAIVAAGIPVAANAYEKVVLAGNAQTLLSTTMTRLRDELGTATNITVTKDNNDRYIIDYTGDTGRNSRIEFSSENGSENPIGIYLTENAGATNSYKHLLVTEQAATKSLYATYGSVTYSNGILTVNDLQVKTIKDNKVITETAKVEIWILTDLT